MHSVLSAAHIKARQYFPYERRDEMRHNYVELQLEVEDDKENTWPKENVAIKKNSHNISQSIARQFHMRLK